MQLLVANSVPPLFFFLFTSTAPTIITTAPTSHELEQPVKRKSMFKILSASKKPSMEDIPQAQQPASEDPPPSRHAAQNSRDSQTEDPLSTSRSSVEERCRLSTASARSNPREHPNDSNRASTATTDARFSESSRSDNSQGEPGGAGGSHHHHQAFSPNENGGSMPTGRRFRMPRLKRNRGSMFPLPPKPTTSTTPANGRSGSTSLKSIASTDAVPRFQPAEDHQGRDHVSPMPSPTRSSVGLSTSGPPPLSRNESGNSALSATSSSSNRKRNQSKTRARSSTMDSVTEGSGVDQQPPNMVPSNRTSTSTSGRKSFGDIFSIPQRLRQNSEPPVPRNGSPGASTPMSKPLSYPERQETDTPATYLSRLEESIPKGAVAGVLAQSSDEFYQTALRKCMRKFSYFGDPIDMAIRKLLMEMELPKETQQIDRFLQAFADRYHECNPGIFASSGTFLRFFLPPSPPLKINKTNFSHQTKPISSHFPY